MSSKLTELLKLAAEDGNAEPLSGFERWVLEKPVVKHPLPKVTVERAFYHYLLFCRDNVLIPLTKWHFCDAMRKTGHSNKADQLERKYRINPEPFYMTDEEELQMKSMRREWEKNLLQASRTISGRIKYLKRKKEAKLRAAKLARLKEKLERKHGATLSARRALKADSSQK